MQLVVDECLKPLRVVVEPEEDGEGVRPMIDLSNGGLQMCESRFPHLHRQLSRK